MMGSRRSDVPREDISKGEGKLLDDTTPAELLDLPTKAKEDFDMLRDAILLYCSLHNMDLPDMVEEREINQG